MRLPQPQLESLCFLFEAPLDVVHALGPELNAEEGAEIQRLFALGLPPVTSVDALSVMFGYNPGFVWSLINKTTRHYRQFTIPKGRGVRLISAPHVGLKAIQKWLGFHFQKSWYPNEHVFGFVPGRSHIEAAAKHLGARWTYSVDIENFFPSVSGGAVREALVRLGYRTDASLNLITRLACMNQGLAQGAPSSPIISNVALHGTDEKLAAIALQHDLIFTRYADDIVFSGKGNVPEHLSAAVKEVMVSESWVLADHKEEFVQLPSRLKVHGLLVHGETLRLTKGYRNRIRALKHLLEKGKILPDDIAVVSGHLNYSKQIELFNDERSTNALAGLIDF
ncbi:MAG: RNA-directed polymerase [Alphaproteobacteria bacterium]|nr:RNA-directed polymerase [Alphaproteobacteria bacterium]